MRNGSLATCRESGVLHGLVLPFPQFQEFNDVQQLVIVLQEHAEKGILRAVRFQDKHLLEEGVVVLPDERPGEIDAFGLQCVPCGRLDGAQFSDDVFREVFREILDYFRGISLAVRREPAAVEFLKDIVNEFNRMPCRASAL
jgi:hypothetical protein